MVLGGMGENFSIIGLGQVLKVTWRITLSLDPSLAGKL